MGLENSPNSIMANYLYNSRLQKNAQNMEAPGQKINMKKYTCSMIRIHVYV